MTQESTPFPCKDRFVVLVKRSDLIDKNESMVTLDIRMSSITTDEKDDSHDSRNKIVIFSTLLDNQ